MQICFGHLSHSFPACGQTCQRSQTDFVSAGHDYFVLFMLRDYFKLCDVHTKLRATCASVIGVKLWSDTSHMSIVCIFLNL